MNKRVVITGAGILSPIGTGVDDFWSAIFEQKSGIDRVDFVSDTALPSNVAAEAKGITDKSARDFLTKPQKKSKKVMCREILLGVISANLCIDQSGLDVETPDAIDHERLGIEFGANQMFSPPVVLAEGLYARDSDGNLTVCLDDGTFRFDQWGEHGIASMDPLWLLKYLPNMPACHIGIRADARGPNNSLTLAEASGNSAMGEAFRIISRGRADMMLCGSTGSRIHPVKCLHAAVWDQLASYDDDDPSTWCRPFDSTRRGQVVGEGACTFLFEEEEHAKSRGATVYGTVLGTGSSCVIAGDGTVNQQSALANAMRLALRDADLSPADVGHVNANGLGETQADRNEAAAIKEVFGDYAATVPVTAPKSFLGNSGAACGTLELATSLFGLRHGVVPATINCKNPDEECGLNIVHGEHLATENKVVLNVNVTSNGQAAAMVVCGA
jgi:3-oxoacyl-[acyl-carrier-protein] synthase II